MREYDQICFYDEKGINSSLFIDFMGGWFGVIDCEWKVRMGNICAASFDWKCSGICKSVERMKDVHNSCGEGDGAVWNVDL